MELGQSFRGWPMPVLLVLWVAVLGMEVFEGFRAAEYGTALLPTTALVLDRLGDPVRLFGILLLVYFSAEAVWRERLVGMDEIVDSTPAPSGLHVAAKALVLGILVGALIVVAVAAAVAFQLASGPGPDELLPYLGFACLAAVPLLLVAVLFVFLQTLVPNRYLGMLLAVAAFLLLQTGLGGLEHPMLRYGIAPPVPYSAMGGFSPAAVSFLGLMAYWGSVAALLVLLTCGLWRRGTETRLPARIRALPRRWGRSGRRVALAFGALAAVLGGLVFHQVEVVNGYQAAEELGDWKAAYEKRYAFLREAPTPRIRAISTEVDLEPAARRARIRGRYGLVNESELPLDSVWLAIRRDVEVSAVSLGGEPPAETDPRFGMARFAPASLLPPGGETELRFDLTIERRGISAQGADSSLVENGSFLFSTFALPTLGYRSSYELQDPHERRRRGLAESSRPTTLAEAEAVGVEGEAVPRVEMETVISTAPDQVAVAPGELLESWEALDRRFFRYRTATPVNPAFAYVSARYDVLRETRGGVTIEVYHHPPHAANAERFLGAAARALEYCTEHFGPYPHRQLRLIEIPSFWGRFAGFAGPGDVYFVEDRGFLTDLGAPGRLDVVTKRVAHEVSHQWWGRQLVPATLPGASALVESPARYTELRVLSETYGEGAVAQALAFELDRYLSGRAGGGEVPLAEVGDQAWLYYAKGALVLTAMEDLLGEEAVNGALRSLLTDFPDPEAPPTSRDLVEALVARAPVQARALVREAFEEIVLYDLGVEEARAEELPDGRFRVTATLRAAKHAVAEGGETPLPFDEELEVALFTAYPGARREDSELLLMDRCRLRLPAGGIDGEGSSVEVSWTVASAPAYLGIDPDLHRIDRNRADNLRPVRLVEGRDPAPPLIPSGAPSAVSCLHGAP